MDENRDHDSARSKPAEARVLPKSRARRWWPLFAQILITALALAAILAVTPWRDRVILQDGRTAIVLAEDGDSLTIRSEATSGTLSCVVSAKQVRERHPGVESLLAHARLPWLAAYLLCAAAIGALLVIRWRYLLLQSGGKFSTPWCAATWAQGQVINLLPLSQIGGDIYRIERARHGLGSAATSTGVIATERICGLVALGSVATTGLICSGMLTFSSSTLVLVGIATVMLIATVWCVRPSQQTDSAIGPAHRSHLAADCIGQAQALSHRPTAMFHTWREHLQRTLVPLTELLHRPKRPVVVLSLSIVVQLLAPLSYVTVDRALGFATPAWCYLVAIPVITLATFLPIHVAGIGILEGGLWLFLGRWANRTPADVIAISAAARIMGLIWSAVLGTSFTWPIRPLQDRPERPEQLTGRGPFEPLHCPAVASDEAAVGCRDRDGGGRASRSPRYCGWRFHGDGRDSWSQGTRAGLWPRPRRVSLVEHKTNMSGNHAMRILHLIYDDLDNPWIGGGGAFRTREIYTRLAKRGHHCTVVCGAYPGAHDWQSGGLRYRHVGRGSSFRTSAVSYVLAAWTHLVRYGPGYDVVVEDYSLFCPLFAGLLSRTAAVVQLQLYSPRESFRRFGVVGTVLFASQAWYPRCFAEAIYLTPELASRWPRGNQRRQYVRMGIPEGYLACTTTNGGCPDGPSADQQAAGLTAEPSRPGMYLLYLGRLVYREKGLDVLRDACPRIWQHHPDLRLVLAGAGRYEDTVRQAFADLEVIYPGRVVFAGYVSRSDKEALLRNCLALVLPSREEGEGLCVLEAAAFGKPTIASDIRELLYVDREQIGINTTTGDPQSLAEGVIRLLDEPDLALRLGRQARRWAAQQTWERQAQEYESALLEIVERQRSARRVSHPGRCPETEPGGTQPLAGTP